MAPHDHPSALLSASTFLSFDIVKTLPALPARLSDVNAWHGHIPFARWLIQAMRPRTLVELGVHKGDSYCAFCEMVAQTGLDTQCHGIDSWEGDVHSGFYGEEIYLELSDHHDPRYGHFSRLIRAYFADALDRFADGSIDLLHIDGLHTYDAVRSDFESWLPKTSDCAVVLFHDTAVLWKDFGVWRLWTELTERYPHFSFSHSNGLGVLAVGADMPPAIRWLTGLSPDDADELRAFFEGMGRRIMQEGAVARLEDETRALSTRLQAQADAFDRQNKQILEINAHWHDQLKTEMAHLRERLTDREAEAARLDERLQRKDSELMAKDAALSSKDHELIAKNAEMAHLQECLTQKDAQLAEVYGSRSWRVTAPLRAVMSVRSRWKPVAVRTVRSVPFVGEPALREARVLRQRLKRPPQIPEADDLTDAKEAFRRRLETHFTAFMTGDEDLQLPASARPKVTVLLVLWNQAPLTLACLRALSGEFDLPLEVVIVDNASTDRTGEMLERVHGARILRNDDNLGFLKAVNQGVAEARGEHVLLLNNDAVMRPGSLAAAVETLEGGEDVGAVGGRIVLLNDRLQEGGSIIWRDGSCLGYARGALPEAGEVMFRRDVDYCSGVFLLFRRKTFEYLGGFDEAFLPCYYEETDFCLRLWESGKRVVYDPRAVIDHFEFGSSEKSADALALQARNRATFEAKHAETLTHHHLPGPESVLEARMRGKHAGRLLMIDDRVPLPDLGAGYPRACHLLREIIAAGYFVTLYPLQEPVEDWERTYAALPLEAEVMMDHGLAGLSAFLEERQGYYDTLLVSRPHNMEVVKRLLDKAPELFAGMKIIYDAEALFAGRDAAKAKLFKDTAELRRAEKAIAAEIALAKPAHHVITVSDAEAHQFREQLDGVVHVIGHALVPEPTSRPFDARENLLFVGAMNDDHSPNVDSLVWFVKEVMPRLHEKAGQAIALQAAGANKAPLVQALRGVNVSFLGRVDSLASLYDASRVFIAPTRYAGGIPHKVHEAASHGLPVVATSLLARQLGWRHEEELLVADSPDDFAEQVARLYADPDLWQALRDTALARVAKDCSPERFTSRLHAILNG